MKIQYTGTHRKVKDAVNYVNELFSNNSFWDEIRRKENFEYTNLSPSDITDYIRNKSTLVNVKLYKKIWPRHRRTNGYTISSKPNTIFLNKKRLWRNIGDIVNTIVHEYVHLVDFSEDDSRRVDFGHGNQSPSGKGNSAPYWIGSLAEEFYLKATVHEETREDISNDIYTTDVGFSGEPVTRWIGSRNMVLEEPFFFIDSSQRKWLAPKGSCLNGATIPRVLWSAIGAPYSGKYRRATIVHDVAVGELCNPNVSHSDRRKADRMFYEACMADGCSRRFSAILYAGVRFGTWRSRFSSIFKTSENESEVVRESANDLNESDRFWKIIDDNEAIINSGNLDELDALLDSELESIPVTN